MTTAMKNQPKYDSSQFRRIKQGGTILGLVGVGTLVLLLAAATTPAESADQKEPKTSIPKIAAFAWIKVGYSTMEELEGRLGKGKVEVGGHPNGARLWRVKGTSWVIETDYFDFSERGAVVDSLGIEVDPKPRHDLPYTRLTKNDLTLAGGISLGMDEGDLLKFLKHKSWTVSRIADGWQAEARGYSPLVGDNFFNHWTARFTIKGKSLVRISLDARHVDVPVSKQAGPGQKK